LLGLGENKAKCSKLVTPLKKVHLMGWLLRITGFLHQPASSLVLQKINQFPITNSFGKVSKALLRQGSVLLSMADILSFTLNTKQ
jgi:uncharacterized membrane protein